MAAIKISAPPRQSGDVRVDISNILMYLDRLSRELNYVLSHIDDENMVQEREE